ncbi:hypothetical protein BDZ94DRAFT_1272420 [Collybia nuda]|uniref:Uncharacterized protein n=1 Tax=Collybia nuda TaxID=64659 RepID=A0A9P5XY40_9AGAR|nr:hypothetical protein BDZ94DRAFT_1272420 [Collybia nuda]
MAELKRDICNIGDSSKLNAEVLDLKERLEKYLPEHVRYASQLWHKHLLDTGFPDELCMKTSRFFSLRVCYIGWRS